VSARAADQIAADGTWAGVSNALFAASDGDFVSIPSGSNVWAGRLRVTKQVTIRGSSSNYNGTVINLDPTADTKDGIFLIEKDWCCISNMYLRATDAAGPVPQGWLVALHTNNCLVRNTYFTRCLAGVVGGSFSLVSHCMFYNCERMGRCFGMAPLNGNMNAYNDAKWVTTFSYTNFNGNAFDATTNFFASTNFMVFEDNLMDVDGSTMPSGRLQQACITSQQGQMWIARHNYISLRNNYIHTPAFDMHGGGDCCSDYGALCVQTYSNIFNVSSGGQVDKLLDQRGGVGTCYSNWINTAFNDTIHMRNASGTGEFWDKGPQVTNSWHWANFTNNGANWVGVTSDISYIELSKSYHTNQPATVYQMTYPDPVWNFFVPTAVTTLTDPVIPRRVKGVKLRP
jgi:hypothetical protein